MRRTTVVLLIFYVCYAQYVFGQNDYRKRELGANVSIVGADTKGAFNNDKSRDALYGFEVQGAYNISRFWGFTADFSYSQKTFVETGFVDLTSRVTQMMGGIKLQDNANNTRFRPFAHALAGVAHTSDFPRVFDDTHKVIEIRSGTGLGFVAGGGLDIRLTRRVELRAFQIDYNPTRLNGNTLQNLRLGIGFNFRF